MTNGEWPADPKRGWKKRAPAGRRCEVCAAPLSQYNREKICALCKRKDPLVAPDEYLEDL